MAAIRSVSLLLVALFAGAVSADEKPARAPELVLVYLSAWNCGACAAWEATELPAFEASAERKLVAFRKIEVPDFNRTDEDQYWPADLRWLRDRYGVARGTPKFALVRDREVLAGGYATKGWRSVSAALRKIAANEAR